MWTALLADCPLSVWGRAIPGEGTVGEEFFLPVLLVDLGEAAGRSFEGDGARGEGVAAGGFGLAAMRGEVTREDDDTTELAFLAVTIWAGGEVGMSGAPLAWKNFGWNSSSSAIDPTAEAPEL